MDDRLAEKLEAKQFYDYEQLVKTLFFKFKLRKREKEMKDLMKKAMTDLSNNNQKDLVVDILEIYFTEQVKKVKEFGAVDDYLVELCRFAVDNGDVGRVQDVLERIIGHTNNKRYELSDMLGCSLRDQGIYSHAYKYFMKSRNVEQIAFCLERTMQTGYQSEQDLFVARACVDMLIKSQEIEKTRTLREHFRDKVAQTPLLTFIDFLVEAIEAKEFEMIKQMANQDYAAELKRDSSLYEKVNTITEKYFSQGIKKTNQMQAMLSNLLGGGGAGRPGAGGAGLPGMGGFGGMANALM